MKNFFLIIFLLLIAVIVKSQNIDSFTVDNSNPQFSNCVKLISLSTNCTSVKWEVSGKTIGATGYPNDSVANVYLLTVGCIDVKLIVGRGSNFDTILRSCFFNIPQFMHLAGKNPDTLDVFNVFNDPGVVFDSIWFPVKIKLQTKNNIDKHHLGNYSVKYYAVDDLDGTKYDSLEREVVVADRVAPLIFFPGGNPFIIDINCTSPIPEVVDNYWPSSGIIIHHSGSIDSSKLGYDTMYYWAEDGSGNLSGKFQFIVQVVNVRPPFVSKDTTIEVFNSYKPIFKVLHSCCDAKDVEVFTSGNVDTSKLGTYTAKIWMKDCRGIISDTTSQTVFVVDKTPPVVKLLTRYDYITINTKDTLPYYLPDSISITDNYDKNLKPILSGTYFTDYLVNFHNGTYSIFIRAKDLSGNWSDITSFLVFAVGTGISKNNVNQINFYPNPTDGMLNIELGSFHSKIIVTVRNSLGQEVKNQEFSHTKSIQLSLPQEAGLYFVEITTGNKIAFLKVIKN